LGAVISHLVAEEMERDEAFRAHVWREIITSEAPGSLAIDIRQRRSAAQTGDAPVSESEPTVPAAPRSGAPVHVPGEVNLSWLETDSFARFQATNWRHVPYAESHSARGC